MTAGDRVAEIRGRVEAGGLNKRDASDLAFLLNMLGLRTAEREYRKDENAELAAENARLRAQLDGVRELADELEHDAHSMSLAGGESPRPKDYSEGHYVGVMIQKRNDARLIRAALNQGGETNGD